MSDQAAEEAVRTGDNTERAGEEFRNAYQRYLDTLKELQDEWYRAVRLSYADSCRLQLETWLVQIGAEARGADGSQDASPSSQDCCAAAWSSIDGPKKVRAAYLAFLQDVRSAWSTTDLGRIDTALLLGIGNSLVAAAYYSQGIEREPA